MKFKTICIFLQRSVFGIVIIGSFIFSISSCNKKPESIGLDLVNQNISDVAFDTTISVSAYSSLEDSVRTDETSLNLLGSQNTDVFGLTDASFYTQIRLSTYQPDFGEDPVVDSAVFSLVYSGYYGNINTQQTVKVHRLSESIFIDSSYYSFSQFNYNEVDLLADYTFTPKPNDSVMIDSTSYAAELRIPLNENFTDSIFYEQDTSNFTTNEEFLEFFKGLYVTTESVSGQGDGAILSFDLLSERSRVTIYYQNANEDSLSYTFTINLVCARVGNFQHDYLLSNDQIFIDQVIGEDTTLGEGRLYLQGLAGVQAMVRFPGITKWIESENIAINQARFIIPLAPTIDDLDPPNNIILLRQDENGNKMFLEDQIEGDNYFGGSYNSGPNNYQFRITFYIQDLVNGAPDYGLVLYPSGKTIKASEVTMWGTSQPQRMKLEITYTRIN